MKYLIVALKLERDGSGRMKVLIVYDSVSPMKLTAKIAETIGSALKEKGLEVDSFIINDAPAVKMSDYGCMIVGGPTMAFKMSKGVSQFLDLLPDKELSGKFAAAFDTQIQHRLSGSAAKGIDGRLKKLGLRVIAVPLESYIEGKDDQLRLKEGEMEKAKNWAQEVAKALQHEA